MKEIMEMLKNIRLEMQTQKQEITDSINSNIDQKFNKIESKYIELNRKIEEQEERIDQIEKYIRRKNLVVFGVEEKETNSQDLTDILLQIVNKKMSVELSSSDIEFVYRLGKKNTKPRPIILSLTTVNKKIKILKSKNALNDTPYYIKEHFSQKILNERKILNEKVKKLRCEGKNAIIKYNKIIILNENLEQLENTRNIEYLGNINNMTKKPLSKQNNKRTKQVKT